MIDADGHVCEPPDRWERNLPGRSARTLLGANAARSYGIEDRYHRRSLGDRIDA